jgi:hypothetical protein
MRTRREPPLPISPERAFQILEVIAHLSWKSATSERYKDEPHQYTVKRNNPECYAELFDAIYRHGLREPYVSPTTGKVNSYRYLYLPGHPWKYWAMSGSLAGSHVLNRALISG